jgi:uncharacterized protein DUF6176
MTKTIITVLLAAFLGASAALLMTSAGAQPAKSDGGADDKEAGPQIKYPLRAKLQRFEVIEGKERRFTEWMNFLRAERAAAVETLEDEKTYFEAVFSEKNDGRIYAFWLTFKGGGGKPVESSKHELDRKHLEFWNECIKKDSRKVLDTEFYLTPSFFDQAIAEHQTREK